MLRYVYQLVANCACLPFTAEPLRRASGLFFPWNKRACCGREQPYDSIMLFKKGMACKGRGRRRQTTTFLPIKCKLRGVFSVQITLDVEFLWAHSIHSIIRDTVHRDITIEARMPSIGFCFSLSYKRGRWSLGVCVRILHSRVHARRACCFPEKPALSESNKNRSERRKSWQAASRPPPR